jgi:hypothetical protein
MGMLSPDSPLLFLLPLLVFSLLTLSPPFTTAFLFLLLF